MRRLLCWLAGIPYCACCGARHQLTHYDGLTLCREHARWSQFLRRATAFEVRADREPMRGRAA